ncbi:MAG: haloacid dehalogenase [Comamonadaceae bacterium SCN 68-20]|nr:HAD hydrolase-like protein [Comamonadaceae bacterium]ODU60158.1 MAG: haloacid dehalogenase [Comamonadaceae bacterium SCN 68-20]OJX05681.1 MAG: haloacid dehalogenase [Burkholderiales bacterium 68-20]
MKYRFIIFDFDGVIADSYPFFLEIFSELANLHNFKDIPKEMIPECRRKSAREMMRVVGLPSWKLPFVAKDFIKYMQRDSGKIKQFPGIEDVLETLNRGGASLSIVSSNSMTNIKNVIGDIEFGRMNSVECGASIFGKATRLAKAMKSAGFKPSESIYIGDQLEDLHAARKAGCAFGVVAWGYGVTESFKKYTPEEEFDSVASIKRLVF